MQSHRLNAVLRRFEFLSTEVAVTNSIDGSTEYYETLEEHTAEKEKFQELRDKHAATWKQDKIDLELKFVGWEKLYG